jgi:uncharacterized NAD-dependent epimerase/dehydratase family protein
VGISINTEHLAEAEARVLVEKLEKEHSLPTTDPIRFGVGAIVANLLRLYPQSKAA